LARALAVQADVLLMDEPLANLDPPHQSDWLALVRQLVADGKTVVSVLHETTMALQADDMLIMAAGKVTHFGTTADAVTHRALEHVFENRIAIKTIENMLVSLPKM
jgi:iron complex transport system ATP-binding protein